MAGLQDLQKYIDYNFYDEDDYKSFERKYINFIKTICRENSWEVAWVSKNYYSFSACIKYKCKYVYISISDVRFWANEWHNNILCRTMENEKDYRGGQNYYVDLPHLSEGIKTLFDM